MPKRPLLFMKKALRYLRKLLLGLLLLVLSYGLLAMLLTFIPLSREMPACEKREAIYVSSNGVHLYFILPRSFFEEAFLEKLNPPAGYSLIYVGWGERDFYRQTPTWSDLEWEVALKAGLWPTASAMHLHYYRRVLPKWKKVKICPEQQEALQQFIQDSFEEKEGGFRSLEAQGYGPQDYFYEAKGSYTALYTCNTWVNQGLKAADIRACLWTPFDFGVLYHLDRVRYPEEGEE